VTCRLYCILYLYCILAELLKETSIVSICIVNVNINITILVSYLSVTLSLPLSLSLSLQVKTPAKARPAAALVPKSNKTQRLRREALEKKKARMEELLTKVIYIYVLDIYMVQCFGSIDSPRHD
jgi:hypothetical protein